MRYKLCHGQGSISFFSQYSFLYLESENPENENQMDIQDKLQQYKEKYAKKDFDFDEFDDECSDFSGSDNEDNED